MSLHAAAGSVAVWACKKIDAVKLSTAAVIPTSWCDREYVFLRRAERVKAHRAPAANGYEMEKKL